MDVRGIKSRVNVTLGARYLTLSYKYTTIILDIIQDRDI